MVLYVVDSEGAQQTISEAPTEPDVESAVATQPWSDITFVTLEVDDDNSMTLSGSVPDGIALVWFEQGEQRLAFLREPSDGVPILQSYLRGDGGWKNAVPWE